MALSPEVTGDIRASLDASDRWTAALTWTPTEFSRLRMQYSYNDILTAAGTAETFNTVWLQFVLAAAAVATDFWSSRIGRVFVLGAINAVVAALSC